MKTLIQRLLCLIGLLVGSTASLWAMSVGVEIYLSTDPEADFVINEGTRNMSVVWMATVTGGADVSGPLDLKRSYPGGTTVTVATISTDVYGYGQVTSYEIGTNTPKFLVDDTPRIYTFWLEGLDEQNNPLTSNSIQVEVNGKPVAYDDDDYEVDEDPPTPLSVDAPGVLNNDTDAQGDALEAVLQSGPSNAASFTLYADGSFTYTPKLNFNGTDSFTYKARDEHGALSNQAATVTITVNPVNDPPNAVDDYVTIPSDSSNNAIDVLDNDTDPDDDPLSVISVTQPSHGTASANGTNALYTPAANFTGTDSFVYTISDGNGGTDSAVVHIDVVSIADLDVDSDNTNGLGQPDRNQTEDDIEYLTTWTGKVVIASDRDRDGDGIVDFADWEIRLAGSSAVFVPVILELKSPIDISTATVTLTYDASDPTGVTADPTREFYSLPNDGGKHLRLWTLDGAGPRDPHSVLATPQAGHFIPSGTSIPATTLGFHTGTNGRTVTLYLEGVRVTDPKTSLPITVSATSSGNTYTDLVRVCVKTNTAPVAIEKWVTTDEDTACTVTLEGQDPQNREITYHIARGPASGTLGTINQTNGQVQYTPSENFNGADEFFYYISVDNGSVHSPTATVHISVDLVNDPPVASDGAVTVGRNRSVQIMLDATDADGDTLTYSITQNPNLGTLSNLTQSPPSVTYTAGEDWGDDTFVFQVSDGHGGTDSGTISVSVLQYNVAPTAYEQTVATDEDRSISIYLEADDPNQDPLTYYIVQVNFSGAVGTLSGFNTTTGEVDDVNGANNVVTFTPAEDWHGDNATFTFKVNDGTLDSNIATVTLSVDNVNDPPVAYSTCVTTNEDTPVQISLSATDADNDPLTYHIQRGPRHGSLGTISQNQVTYTPHADWHGTDTFTFYANDGQDDSNVANVTVIVQPMSDANNDPPVAEDQSLQTPQSTALNITLSGIDYDGPQALTYAIASQPGYGTLTGTPPNVTYTPTTGWFGVDEFTFTVYDGVATSEPGYITITVSAMPEGGEYRPYAYDQSVTVTEDTPQQIELYAEDPDNDPLTYYIVTSPSHGTLQGVGTNNVVLNGNKVIYAPAKDFVGQDSFTFKVNDGTLDSNTATVSISVSTDDDPTFAFDVHAGVDENIGQTPTPTVAITLKATDRDVPDPADLTYQLVTLPQHGALTDISQPGIIVTRTVTYTPSQDWYGTDTFTFQAREGTNAWSNVATVYVVVDQRPSQDDMPYVRLKLYTDASMSAGSERYTNIGGKAYVVLEIGLGPLARVNSTTFTIRVDETECGSSWSTGLIHLDSNSEMLWQRSTNGVDWATFEDGPLPTDALPRPTGYEFVYFRRAIEWDTQKYPLGHNGQHTIMALDPGGESPNIELWRQGDIIDAGPTPIQCTVKNLVITNVSTSNGNAKNDYIKYDPNGDANLARPRFNFTFEDGDPPEDGEYRCVVYMRETGNEGWGSSNPYLYEVVQQPQSMAMDWDGSLTPGNTSKADRGTYTFDIYVYEFETQDSGNWYYNDMNAYKTPYCLSVGQHAVWINKQRDSEGAIVSYELRCYYLLNDQSGEPAAELSLVTVDKLLEEYDVMNSNGREPSILYNGNGEGILTYSTDDDDFHGWRVIFIGEDAHSLRRNHSKPRMLAVNEVDPNQYLLIFIKCDPTSLANDLIGLVRDLRGANWVNVIRDIRGFMVEEPEAVWLGFCDRTRGPAGDWYTYGRGRGNTARVIRKDIGLVQSAQNPRENIVGVLLRSDAADVSGAHELLMQLTGRSVVADPPTLADLELYTAEGEEQELWSIFTDRMNNSADFAAYVLGRESVFANQGDDIDVQLKEYSGSSSLDGRLHPLSLCSMLMGGTGGPRNMATPGTFPEDMVYPISVYSRANRNAPSVRTAVPHN